MAMSSLTASMLTSPNSEEYDSCVRMHEAELVARSNGGKNHTSEGENMDKDVPYQELIGCLLYLSTNTRPDIAYVVSFLSQFNSKHTKFHWNLGKRVLSYLKKTSTLGLKYEKSNNPTYCLTGFADADLAGNPKDYYSYCGFSFNLLRWKSHLMGKQKANYHSTVLN